MSDPKIELDGFLAKYTPEIARRGREIIDQLHRRIPAACRLVYDNYNALVVGYGPDDRASNAILSVALYPKWVSLFFLQASRLEDPQGLFRGSSKAARHIVLSGPADLERADIGDLIDQALAKAKKPLPPHGEGPLIIKSVSAKQRPRRP